MSSEPVFRHFKGGRYRLLMAAANSEQPEENLMIYISLETGKVWARPASSWNAEVEWPDGLSRPRFVREGDLEVRFSISSSLGSDPPGPPGMDDLSEEVREVVRRLYNNGRGCVAIGRANERVVVYAQNKAQADGLNQLVPGALKALIQVIISGPVRPA